MYVYMYIYIYIHREREREKEREREGDSERGCGDCPTILKLTSQGHGANPSTVPLQRA